MGRKSRLKSGPEKGLENGPKGPERGVERGLKGE
jgi:hypothetical protein